MHGQYRKTAKSIKLLHRLIVALAIMAVLPIATTYYVFRNVICTTDTIFSSVHCHMERGKFIASLPFVSAQRALTICDLFHKKESDAGGVYHCWDGVFAGYFKREKSVKMSLESLAGWCKTFKDKKSSSCITQGWILFADETKTPEGITAYCSLAPDALGRRNCLDTLIQRAAQNNKFNPLQAVSFCGLFPEDDQSLCLADIAISMILLEKIQPSLAPSYCRKAKKEEIKENCLIILSVAEKEMSSP